MTKYLAGRRGYLSCLMKRIKVNAFRGRSVLSKVALVVHGVHEIKLSAGGGGIAEPIGKRNGSQVSKTNRVDILCHDITGGEHAVDRGCVEIGSIAMGSFNKQARVRE